jgi:methylated-DNA-[protein]-cysteine S-methyltransferase
MTSTRELIENTDLFTDYYHSPIGHLQITGTDKNLTSIQFCEDQTRLIHPNEITGMASEQLNSYFQGQLKKFSLPLLPSGTEFQKKVWEILLQIPFGETTTYQKQAIKLGDPKAIRAMASANGKNPIAIIIPCHRVIGTNGGLTGYAGELWRKDRLLELEAKQSGKWNKLF